MLDREENEDTRGLTLRELVLELRANQYKFMDKNEAEHDEIRQGLSSRPTRAELASFLGGLGALVGVIIAVITLGG